MLLRKESASPPLWARRAYRPIGDGLGRVATKPADDALAAALASVKLLAPRVPVWSNVDARPHTGPEEIRGLLVRQVVQPVRREETMRGLLAAGVTRFYEIGPGRVLTGLLKRV
jgi:[acyl-carrier-protein] S-malonyltransferase